MANPVSMYAAEVEMSSVSQRANDELVPSGWARRYSVEHGRFYYSNEVTGESVWHANEISIGD